jgi:hypothetical protein
VVSLLSSLCHSEAAVLCCCCDVMARCCGMVVVKWSGHHFVAVMVSFTLPHTLQLDSRWTPFSPGRVYIEYNMF